MLAVDLAPTAPVDAQYAVVPVGFLAAEASKRFRQSTSELCVRVVVCFPDGGPRQPVLVAESQAERQHRRKTWAENLARYALPKGTSVRVDYSGGSDAHALLEREDGSTAA